MGGTERSQFFREVAGRNETLAFFRRAMRGAERSHTFEAGGGRNGAVAILSEGDGRNGTLVDFLGGRLEERSARGFFRRVMGGTERSRNF